MGDSGSLPGGSLGYSLDHNVNVLLPFEPVAPVSMVNDSNSSYMQIDPSYPPVYTNLTTPNSSQLAPSTSGLSLSSATLPTPSTFEYSTQPPIQHQNYPNNSNIWRPHITPYVSTSHVSSSLSHPNVSPNYQVRLRKNIYEVLTVRPLKEWLTRSPEGYLILDVYDEDKRLPDNIRKKLVQAIFIREFEGKRNYVRM